MSPEEGEGVPCSNRIIQDCDKALESIRTVYYHRGAIVEGLADRNGIQYYNDGTGQHGGKRVKSFLVVDFKWLDPGAAEALRETQENIGASCRAEAGSDES